jgi:uncharacterized phage protein gp47/JayE
MCSDQLERLEKRLEALKKSFMKEYKIALNVINNPIANEKRSEIMFDVETIFNDTASASKSIYASAMNKVMGVLKRDL